MVSCLLCVRGRQIDEYTDSNTLLIDALSSQADMFAFSDEIDLKQWLNLYVQIAKDR